MSRKKFSKEFKLKLLKEHDENGISYWKLGKEYGIEASIIRRWGYAYATFGEAGLEKHNSDQCNYSAEFKQMVVTEYLEGKISIQDLAYKHKILAPSTVRTWIKQYNNHEEFWGLMKREMYYGKKYKTKEELVKAIEQYLDYYANKRVQRNLGILTPMEYHTMKLQNVA
ncbi:MAG: IS3 family transposase [Roseburia sp.]